MNPQDLLGQSFFAALEAASPERLLEPVLQKTTPPDFVLSLGKAALHMMQAVLKAFPEAPGLVVVPKGTPKAVLPEHIQLVLAGHPTPDDQSVQAAHLALDHFSRWQAHRRILMLVSGGGSALFCAPWGVTLQEKQQVAQHLMRAGASIQELNTVRKHLSLVKGGRLAAATRAQIEGFLISDVVGDDPSVIASGPAVPDASTFQDALDVLNTYRIEAPAVVRHLQAGIRGELPETPKTLSNTQNTIIGSNRLLLEAARNFLERQGCKVLILSDQYTGEARDLAQLHAQKIREIRASNAGPVVLLSGGEATVTVTGQGRGGRNQEFALWLLQELKSEGVHALVAGSDGIDGSSLAAGAFLTPGSWEKAQKLGLDPLVFLKNNDSDGFFARMQDQLVTGPTGHNLNDFRVVCLKYD